MNIFFDEQVAKRFLSGAANILASKFLSVMLILLTSLVAVGQGVAHLHENFSERDNAPAATVVVQRWSETLPTIGNVTVNAGQTILLDTDVQLGGLQINGTVVCADQDLSIYARWIMIHGAGKLQCGTLAQPFTKQLKITLNANQKLGENVMGMGTKFLGTMMGGALELHGRPVTSWTKLAGTAEPGTSTISVLEANNWQVGDTLVVAPTDYEPSEAEERIITNISGTLVALDRPLYHRHWGQIQTLGNSGATMDERAEVGLLSRNIIIRGRNAPGKKFGGHLMFMEGSASRMSNVEVTGMGQLGRLGRYPIHYHIMGDTGNGSYLLNSAIHNNFQRGIVVHRTNDLQIRDNVVYNTVGHLVFLESSNERRNTFERNLVMGTRPVPLAAMNPEIDFEHKPDFNNPYSRVSGFWISNQNNRFINNHAVGILHGHGYWFAEAAALYNGRDNDLWPYRPGGAEYNTAPFRGPINFAGNVAHTIRPAAEYGGSNPMRVTGNAVMLDAVNFNHGDVTVNNLRAWKVSMYAVWGLGLNTTAPIIDGLITADAKSAVFNGEHNGIMRVRNSVFYGMTNNQPVNRNYQTFNWSALWNSYGHFPDDLTIEPVSTYPDNLGVPAVDGLVPEAPMIAPGPVTGAPRFAQYNNVRYGGWIQ